MFKNKSRFKSFIKRQIAKLLAITMALSSLGSVGMVISTAHAAKASVNDYGQSFVDELVRITAAGTKYEWGGWLNPNVDCRGFVRGALKNAYGLSIYDTDGYLVDEEGNPVLDKNGNRTYIDVAAYMPVEDLGSYVGKRICVEGNGIKTYYRVLTADYCKNTSNVLDIKFNGCTYSSLIAYACQFPGSIIAHNGHYGVALGEFHSAQEIIDAYPGLGGECSGTAGGDIIRWSESAYNLGNSYPKDDYRYWFGKTVFLSACSSKSGIRADNFTTTGKTANPPSDSELTILLCEPKPSTCEISFTKVDQATNGKLAGAKYGIYTDAACKKLVTTFTTSTEYVKVKIEQGTYYVKELEAPVGYALSTEIVKVNANNETAKVELYDKPTNATVLVRKVDAHDSATNLSGTKFMIQEWNYKNDTWRDMVELTYSQTAQAFTISKTYTNSEGVQYSDNSLHYSQTNQGYFKLIETGAQSGYTNNGYTKVFNVNDGSLRLIGNKAITNNAKLALLIKKVTPDGKPLAGAKMVFDYCGTLYKGTTDSNGQLLFEDIPEGDTTVGVLYEVQAPLGYVPTSAYIDGQEIALSKATKNIANGCFRTTVKVVNGTAEDPPVVVTKGSITIKKTDTSRIDQFDVGVPNAYYTIYKDGALTSVAKDQNGKELKNLKTDANGLIVVDNLDLGIYYIREVKAPDGYAMQLRTFPINLLSDAADENGMLSVTTNGVGDPRQTVVLSLKKVDSITQQPVENAVYALYAESNLLTSTAAQTVPNGTLLGYYKTDSNGMIEVDRFGTKEIRINGEWFKSVSVVSADGNVVDQDALVNGKYYFVEVSASSGYTLNTNKIHIDASWQENQTATELVVANGVVSSAGRVLTMNTVITSNDRQTVQMSLFKGDAEKLGHQAYTWYGLTNYESAVKNGMAATLKGAKYQLINTIDVIDIDTGETIPANTVLGVYETGDDGRFTVSTFTQGEYKGHKIPNGRYKFVEMIAPQGYALNKDYFTLDMTWNPVDDHLPTIKFDAIVHDPILKQAVHITKVSNINNDPIAGVSFSLYSVAEILEKCNINVDQLPFDKSVVYANGYNGIDRAQFDKLIADNNLQPAKDLNGKSTFFTNKDGVALTGQFIYGDYILYENAALDGYKASPGMYIQLPWVEYEYEGSDDENNANDVVVVGRYYQHDIDEIPIAPFYATVINTINTKIAIGKYELLNGNRSPVENATLQLLDSNKNVVVLPDGTNCEWRTDRNEAIVDQNGLPVHVISGIPAGKYFIREVATPYGYVSASDVEIDVQATSEYQYFYMENKPTVIEIDKFDAESNTRLIGAQLAIVDEKGMVVRNAFDEKLMWTTNGTTQRFTHVPVGNYFLKEIKAPNGYQRNTAQIPVDVVDSSDIVRVSMNDNRTYGKFSIVKTDAATGEYLSGAEFQVISVEKVVDPISNEVIFEAGEIVDTFISGEGGKAVMTKQVPIATYAADGTVTPIKYRLIESKPVSGQQYDASKVTVDTNFTYIDDMTPVIEPPAFSLTNEKPNVSVIKTATPDTFTGDASQYKNVTVVKNGDEIEYTISVINSGTASAWHVVVKDFVPTNTKFVSMNADHHGVYDAEQNMVHWAIDEIPAGGTVQLKFVVEATSDEACTIVNSASYTMPGDVPSANDAYPNVNDQSLDWFKTNDVVHQIVEFHKTSVVLGGSTKDDAVAVSVGDTIKYLMTFATAADVYNVVITDAIPFGLTYVDGSAKINGQKVDVAYDQETNVIMFNSIDINANTASFEFDVVVDDMELGESRDYANQAMATYSTRGEDGDTESLQSEIVTHKAAKDCLVVKTATPKTYEGVADNAKNVTVLKKDDIIIYKLTVTNTCISKIQNIAVTDIIPSELQYIAHNDVDNVKSWYDDETETLTWLVEELEVGESVELTFECQVVEQAAQLIINNAKYNAVQHEGDDAPILTGSAKVTNDVVHQVVEFHKSSNVAGGINKENATVVSVGDRIDYILVFESKHDVTSVTIRDKIPHGLTYIPGSLAMKRGANEEWEFLDDSNLTALNSGEEAIEIGLDDMDLSAGKHYFKFSAIVERIPVNTDKFYMNQAIAQYDVFTNGEDSEQHELLSEEVHHMTDVKVVGNKVGELETFVGDYKDRTNVTVVKDGDALIYHIAIDNAGVSTLTNVFVQDVLPAYTTFVSADNNGKYDADAGLITWEIPEIESGKSVVLTLIVECNTDGKAREIVNTAYYVVPEDPANIKDNEWIKTDDVIYQTVAIEKSASIEYGVDEKDAQYVAIGTRFTYIIKFTSTNDVYDLVLSDKIPIGLTLIPETVRCVLSTGDEFAIEEFAVDRDRTLILPTIEMAPAGDTILTFDVMVEDVEQYNQDYFFINQATATMKKSKQSPDCVELNSGTVSHKTIKTSVPTVPQLGSACISEAMAWSISAVVSSFAMVYFGFYGFVDRKKKK